MKIVFKLLILAISIISILTCYYIYQDLSHLKMHEFILLDFMEICALFLVVLISKNSIINLLNLYKNLK